jgi:hypothetical protein
MSGRRNGPGLMIASRQPWRTSPARWHEASRVASSVGANLLVDRPPAGAGWLHEVKHDGFRILVRKLGERSSAARPTGRTPGERRDLTSRQTNRRLKLAETESERVDCVDDLGQDLDRDRRAAL